MDPFSPAAEATSGGNDNLRPAGEPSGPIPSPKRSGRRSLDSRKRDPASGERPAPPRLPATAVLDRAATPPFSAGRYNELEVRLDLRARTYWCYLRPRERPSFTTSLLADLARMQQSIETMLVAAGPDDPPVRYFVVGSRLPGIFNLGGNLAFFADRIRDRDRESLRAYARACIEVVYANAVSLRQPLVTIALVEGDAMGGGFEAVLSCNVVVAERGARFGFPEILFNLFPGMGAYSFLARRIGGMRAEEFILSGRVYSAEELHAMGLVHVLAEPGGGEQAVEAFIARNERRHSAQCALYEAGRLVNPLAFTELAQIADLWVEAAMKLTEPDLRLMERLVARQDRRRQGSELLAAE